jgi:cell division protein FtsL
MNQRTPTTPRTIPRDSKAPAPENKRQRVAHVVAFKNRRTTSSSEAPPSDAQDGVDPRLQVARLPFRQNLERWLRVFSLFFVLVPLVVGFCYLVSARHQVLKTGIELAMLSRTQDKLLQENRELSVEKATLRSPARIAEQASKELQMSIPEPKRVIVIDHDGEEIPPLPPSIDVPDSFGGHLTQ